MILGMGKTPEVAQVLLAVLHPHGAQKAGVRHSANFATRVDWFSDL